jgi:hypothetical protein
MGLLVGNTSPLLIGEISPTKTQVIFESYKKRFILIVDAKIHVLLSLFFAHETV